MLKLDRTLRFLGLLPAVVMVVLAMALSNTTTASPAAFLQDEESAEDEQRAIKANDRYLSLLKRNPRMGTSLDKIYGFHIDRGTLDSYIATLAAEVKDSDKDGASAMILGMMEMRRGRDGDSRSAFEHAEQLRPTDPIASWYLGLALIATGETDKAIDALERAISRMPAPADQLEIYQTLGRVYQRNQRTEKALDLWKRFEAAFPNDERVQQQIAATLLEENQLEEALKRLQGLAQRASDPYQKVQFAIQAADIKLKLGQQKEALTDFEEQLGQLKPSSWMFNDVRSRIEASFLRTDDYAGLVAYYEKWMTTHPDDLDAMARVGKYLAIQGRAEAAREWYEKAISKAPSDVKLRTALIEQLIADGKYADAISQYEKLVEFDPGNPDHIERWGMLYLRHESLDEEQRKAKATAVWNSLLAQNPNDAVVVSRVADLYRSAAMTDEALKLYQQCVELAPENPQYLEYLGEYYHILQRPDDAKRTWLQMIAGDLKTTQNLVRLSEVFKGFGYKDEALTTLEEACSMEPEFADLIRFSGMLRDAKRYDDSLAQLARAETMTGNPEERQIILDEQIKTYLEGGQLSAKMGQLIKAIGAEGTSDQWRILALYQEALSLMPDASRSAKKAVEMADESVATWSVYARVTETAGLLSESSEANARLTELDRRYKTEYLKRVADLERRLGRLDSSLQAGKDLIAAAPGNPENYQFYADLCFQLGKPDLGLDALRRSVRVNPGDIGSLMALAKALADQFNTPEAIELYWRAFQKSENLDDKIKVVQTLTELYLRTNTFDRLIARFENMSKELNEQRDMTICLANCYQSAGDIGMAREVLKGLLNEQTRDVLLLDELAKLAEQAEEYAEAVEYQKQIVALAKSPEAESRLAGLLIRAGDTQAAEEIWAQSLSTDAEPHRVIQSIGRLIDSGKFDSARKLCDQLLIRNGSDWEALLLLAVIDWKENRKEDAVKRCDQILALKLDQDAPSHAVQFARSQRSTIGFAKSSSRRPLPTDIPDVFKRMQPAQQLISSLGLVSGFRVARNQGAGAWSADEYGECRYAAITIKMAFATENEKADELLSLLYDAAEKSIASDAQPAWDFYIAGVFQQYEANGSVEALVKAGELLVQRPEPEAKMMYLLSIQQRGMQTRLSGANQSVPQKPLSDKQLDQMLDAWTVVSNSHPEWNNYTGGIQLVIQELSAAGKAEKATEMFGQLIRPEATVNELSSAVELATVRGDLDQMLDLTARVIKLEQTQPNASTGRGSRLALLGSNFAQLAARMASEKKDWSQVDRLVTSFLDIKADNFRNLAASVSGTTGAAGYSTTTHYQIYSGSGNGSYQQVETLTPNAYFNASDITLFVNLSQLYRQRTAELIKLLTDYRNNVEGNRAVFAELAMAHVQFLTKATEQAAIHLVRAAALVPDDVSLRINLVRYYQNAGNNKDALELLDTFEATDPGVMKDREQLALSLALKAGDLSRARLAAERLFGLRLDSNMALELSSQMQQLGMNDMAEALMARTRKTAGNDIATLASLMNSYRSKDNMDVAAQIAHQILTKTSSSSAGTSNSQNPAGLTSARRVAVEILEKTGQLDSMIERVKEQLSRSPKSIPLYQTLEEYYTAAGKTKEAAEVAAQLAELQPANVETLLRMAQQLERAKKYSEACDKYLVVLEKDLQRFSQNYYQYLRTFQNAKRLGDLADILIKSDLRKLQNNSYVVTEVVSYLFQQSGRGNNAGSAERQKGLDLLAAAWKAFPRERSSMLGNIHDESLWESPLVLDYAKQAMIPTSVQQAVAQPWHGIADALMHGSSGSVTGTLTRVCSSLKEATALDEFTTEVLAASEKFPAWHGGKVILCALKAKRGEIDESLAVLKQIETGMDGQYAPANVAWVLGGILEPIDPKFLQPSIDLLEGALARDKSQSMSGNGYSYSSFNRLATLNHKAGNSRKARSFVYEGLQVNSVSSIARSNPGYQEYTDLQNYLEAAKQLLDYGYPFDAIQMYRKITPELVTAGARFGGSSSNAVDTARKAESAAIKSITPAAVLAYFQPESASRKADDPQEVDDTAIAPKPSDLMLAAPPDGVDGTIYSIVLDGLFDANIQPGPELDRLSDLLNDNLSRADLNGPSAAIAAVAFGNHYDRAELVEAGLEKLKSQLPSLKPEVTLPDEIGLWIAAKVALNSSDYVELGSELAERAMLAAEASDDDRWLTAMMKERGDMAIARGDKVAAEKAWSKLLDAVLADSLRTGGNVPPATINGIPQAAGQPTGTALQELRNKLLKPASPGSKP